MTKYTLPAALRDCLQVACLVVAIAASNATSQFAGAQLATLGKGHQLLVNSGLQIWGLNTDSAQYPFNYNNLAALTMDAVIWSHGQSDPGVLTTGQKWGKWVDYLGSPATALDATETAHYADLVAIQVGDEQQTDIEDPNGATKAWFNAAHSGNLFIDKLLYVNSTFINDINAYVNFVASANPDAISWDAYPFGTTGISPYNWLGKAQLFRRAALGSYIGATSTAPRPYGLYLQTYHGGDGARDPSELEMRWQQFTAWTLGYTFVDAFTAAGGNTSLFDSGNGNVPTQPRYDQFKEAARQSKNLGPALTRLISAGYGPDIVLGKNSSGAVNPLSIDWQVFDKSHAPAGQQFLSAVEVRNLYAKNGGHAGDVYIGYFNPLSEVYGAPAGTAYFMVTNALGADLQDPTMSISEGAQSITMDFDFGNSKVNSLQRLNRNTGQVEVFALTYMSGNKYRLVHWLEGGTGDLFKYNDGTPFVGVKSPNLYYWDSDANAANNNIETGAGLGGGGVWDSLSSKWFDGVANVPYVTNSNAVFSGTAGTVTLATNRSANSLTFKTTGYALTGNQLTMSGSYVTADAGVTATINSTIVGTAGLIKNGPGTLNLTGSNTYAGGTSIIDGVLGISSDANLGAIPDAITPWGRDVTLNGGTLRFNANANINNNRGMMIGPHGGTIDTQSFTNPAGYAAVAGGFHGPGDLTKIGSGTFYASAPSGGANTTWTGRLILQEGTWKIIASDGLPYNVPLADGLQPAQVTLDGGTWQMGATTNVTNARRGVTIAAGGGTVDTQNFNFTWAGPWAGSVTTAVVNKIGSGRLTLNSSTNPATYAGIVNVNQGQLELAGGKAMGDLAAINLADVFQSGLIISGASETIGSLSGGGNSGGNVALDARLVGGGNNASTTYRGVLSGAGGLTKIGSGTLTLAPLIANSTYGGGTLIDGGTLIVDNVPPTGGPPSSGTGTGPVVVGTGATLDVRGSVLGPVTTYAGATVSVTGRIERAVTVSIGATFGGNGLVNATVTVNGGGHVAPGPGVDSLDVGVLLLEPGSVLDFELDTVLGVDKSDLINVLGGNGLSIQGGTLNLTNAGSMTSGTYRLIDYAGTLGGSVGWLALGAVPTGFEYSLINNVANKSIDLVVGIPGDHNSDGTVDAADFVVWRKSIGTQTAFNTWRSNFGEPSSASGSSTAVPEPSSALLLLPACVLLLQRSRRRNCAIDD